LEVDGTGSGLCPVSGFGISGVEAAITISLGLIIQLTESASKHEKILFYFHMQYSISSVYKIYKKSHVS
jgi:hypothetical protein